MKTRGDRLRAARKKRFATAGEAAALLGVPAATYGSHERAETPGGRDYGPDEARRYARLLGVSTEWLLIGSGDPPIESRSQGIEADSLPLTLLSLISKLNLVSMVADQNVADLEDALYRIPRNKLTNPPKTDLKEGGLMAPDPETYRGIREIIEHLRAADALAHDLRSKLNNEYLKQLAAQIVIDRHTT